MVLKKFVFAFFLLCSSAINAEQPQLSAAEVQLQANQIFTEVLSPYCPGRMLSDCPSGSASKLKNEIRQKLTVGESKTEILSYLYALYGDEIRAAPRFGGFGIWAWLAPFFFVLIGVFALFLWLKFNSAPDSGDLEDL